MTKKIKNLTKSTNDDKISKNKICLQKCV